MSVGDLMLEIGKSASSNVEDGGRQNNVPLKRNKQLTKPGFLISQNNINQNMKSVKVFQLQVRKQKNRCL